MAFLQVQFYSKTLVVASTINVILPEPSKGIGISECGDEEPPKVLYLLHGYSDDHSIWMRRTSVERYAAAHNLAIVMPAVNHSCYCNEVSGERYWDYVSEELPEVCSRFFRISTRPEDTYVAGLSMGGYGAMRLALTYPERFAAAASFSGAVDLASQLLYSDGLGLARIFGTKDITGTDVDTMYLMKKNAAAEHKPRLYVSCGTDDFLYDEHKRFVPALRENGWDVTSFEKPGATHEWGFWDEQIKAFIEFIYA
ncbi:MAG: prolyl oligopeptidase family serine peptidase [Oscillospiraceae bacterium]|nr:prolyl oligopeptidase family serine peptidase [Oscillospiraceae bacterium]